MGKMSRLLMTFARSVILACLLLGNLVSASTIYVSYSEADFLDALDPAASLRMESFETTPITNYWSGTPTLTLGATGVTVSASRFSISGDDRYASDGVKAVYGVPGGYGRGDSNWQSTHNDFSPLNFSFSAPIHYFGVDVQDLGTSTGQSLLLASLDGGPAIKLLRQGTPYGAAPPDCTVAGNGCFNNQFTGSSLFAAIVSELPFSSIEFSLIEGVQARPGGFVIDDSVGFDNLRFGAGSFDVANLQLVPAPGMLVTSGLGLLMFLGFHRRMGRRY
ncbi:MAG: hypothetical protein GY703_03130 [Gammaproteobacteria bacterium]|nr:hypothetical protein [Gammaproteobacteria bacterium]